MPFLSLTDPSCLNPNSWTIKKNLQARLGVKLNCGASSTRLITYSRLPSTLFVRYYNIQPVYSLVEKPNSVESFDHSVDATKLVAMNLSLLLEICFITWAGADMLESLTICMRFNLKTMKYGTSLALKARVVSSCQPSYRRHT